MRLPGGEGGGRHLRRRAQQEADANKGAPKASRGERLRALLPELWALVRPRRRLLAVGFVLMAINRVSGLVLPASTK